MTRAKRAFDVAASAASLVLLLPLFAVLAAIVRADGGPAFFRQERVGRHGRPFQLWKFRTMVTDAERCGPPLTLQHDARITTVGRWLRRTRLDELPQLVNVLRGEMSLVGPRPEVPRYVARYTSAQRAVLTLVPGITDPASIAYRDEARLLAGAADPEQLYVERIVPDKIRRNLAYAHDATVARDVGVLLATVVALARPSSPRSPAPFADESARAARGPA